MTDYDKKTAWLLNAVTGYLVYSAFLHACGSNHIPETKQDHHESRDSRVSAERSAAKSRAIPQLSCERCSEKPARVNPPLDRRRRPRVIARGGNARAEIGALRRLFPNGYEETPTIIRYNGAMPWSPAVIAKVAKFFQARFGKRLPISVAGQSLTHDRLNYDHREAVDVAVSPESLEGRGLIKYLRQARIPFLPFGIRCRAYPQARTFTSVCHRHDFI